MLYDIQPSAQLDYLITHGDWTSILLNAVTSLGEKKVI